MFRPPSGIAFRAVAVVLLAACAGFAEDPGVRPVHPTTRAEVGRTRVIPFRLAARAEEDGGLPASSSAPDILEVVGGTEVLRGHDLVHVRVRGHRPGRAVLVVGDASLPVEVVSARIPPDPEGAPRIVTPISGAAIWGEITVAVEVDEAHPGGSGDLFLRVSDGRRLEPRHVSHPIWGPTRRLLFDFAAGESGPGPLALVPVSRAPDGVETAGTAVVVHALFPAAAEVNVFEAEEPAADPRPERFGVELPPIGIDPEASKGQYAGNWGSDPAVCLAIDTATAGWYQMVIRARGDQAGGAYPTVGLILDGADEPVTSGVLAADRWHRVAVGVPVRLEAGRHRFTPYFLNDFYAEMLADRNLYLDRVEVARVTADRPQGVAVIGTGEMEGGGSASGRMGMAGGSGAMTMGAGMTMSGTAPAGADPFAPGRSTLRVALEQPLDGRRIMGDLAIRGRCTWPDMENAPPPKVTLHVNGRALDAQRTAAPMFWIDARAFAPGANTIQLVAVTDAGAVAATQVHTVHRPEFPGAEGPAGEDRLRAFLRYPMQDEAWDPGIRDRWSADHHPSEGRSAAFWSEGEAALALPEDLAGTFDVFVEGRGDDFEGPPQALVTLEAAGARNPVGAVDVPPWWETCAVGTVRLAAGPKRISVAFRNDKYEENVGDRNLWLQALVLREARSAPISPPAVRIAWPPAGHAVHAADAVVADAWGDGEPVWAELWIDDRPSGVGLDITRRPGRIVLPILARGLAPGPHTLRVRVADRAGQTGDAPAVPFTVLERAPETPGPYARALRLLDRFAFGARPQDVAAVLTRGEQAWLRNRLDRPHADPAEQEAIAFAMTHFPERDGEYDVAGRILGHCLATENPVQARFVQWAENHFSTWIRKTGADPEWVEHRRFLRLGPAPFGDLLFASARSPAMLSYLDQQYSFSRQLNENYAREILELHTVGASAGYTQEDVTELAHLLTGWTFSEEGDGGPGGPRRRTFRFDPRLNDGAPRRVFGAAFPRAEPNERHDRVRRAIETLAAHPATARFVCRKLAEHYVSLPAPERLVDELAGVFHETHGDLRAVLAAIAAHPEFQAPDLPEKVCTPFDYAVRLARACGLWHPWGLIEFQQRSGMGVLDRSTPDGYPEEDSAYADTNAMLQRWKFVREYAWALADGVPPGWRWTEEPWTDEGRQAVVDAVAVRLTGRLLGEKSNRAALDVLRAVQGGRDEAVQWIAAFVAQLPEASLR